MKVGVGISGGVDSAVTALLLLEQGHDVVGYTMTLGRTGEESSLADVRVTQNITDVASYNSYRTWAVGVTASGTATAADGQTSGDMLGRFEKLVTHSGIKWVSLSCGVNDVWGFDWQRGVMLPDYERNVRRMLDIAARYGVNVVLLTPTLVGEDPARARNRILAPYADFIRAEAKKRGILLADVNRAEIEGLEKLPVKGVKHFIYDGVHPVAAGHELFARTVLEALYK